LAPAQRHQREVTERISRQFADLFRDLRPHRGLTVVAPKGQKENVAQQKFVEEWMQTLQLLRGLAREFAVIAGQNRQEEVGE
jgi:hypothetical protein